MRLTRFLGGLATVLVGGLASAAELPKPTDYGKAGGWALREARVGGAVRLCDTFVFTGSEKGLRFEYNRDSSSIGFSGLASAADRKPMNVEVWFNDKRAESRVVSMRIEADGAGWDWRLLRETNMEPSSLLDGFSNLQTIHFGYKIEGEGPHVETFSLTGANKAVKKTISCVLDAKPAKPSATVAAEAAAGESGTVKPKPAAAAAAKPKVVHGSCRLKVGGRTYVDIKKTCPIWLENDGSGTFWINVDRESYMGDYFAELAPKGDGTASGHWNGQKGATHAQGFLGEDFQMSKGGCWVNAKAEICAAQ